MKKLFFAQLMLLLLFLFACVSKESKDGKRSLGVGKSKDKNSASAIKGGTSSSNSGPGDQQNAGAVVHEEGDDSDDDDSPTGSKVELMHFIDPYEGSYKTKITIPKNFNGLLYLSGLNLGSLSSKLVSVRFFFGRELEPITIPATIGRASGLTPQTDIYVLIMDLNNAPFENIRLLYDLYDYNSYATSDSPTQDPLNGKLYCRGLDVQYDPTFAKYMTSSNLLCDSLPSTEKCLYAYAKIKDSGLYRSKLNGVSVTQVAYNPQNPLIDFSGSDFQTDLTGETAANINTRNQKNLTKCLPDNGKIKTATAGVLNYVQYGQDGAGVSFSATVLSVLDDATSDQTDYTFRGPYRLLNCNTWAITGDALFGSNGIFMDSILAGASTCPISPTKSPYGGVSSLIFPRAGKLSLRENVEYLGSSDKIFTSTSPYTAVHRKRDVLLTPGDSKWMDGCNLRVSNFDQSTAEGIGSCNVTASLQLVTTDPTTKKELTLMEEAAINVKLQLVRPSEKDYAGREILYQSMKTCTSSRACGSDECCFNQRCWSKELVSQCKEESNQEGNLMIGDSCSSDFQCSSLCCDRSIGRCTVHNALLDPPVMCSKPPGEQCVASEWCRLENIRSCVVVKTGTTVTGQITCALRCFNQQVHGDCVNGACIAPTHPPVPDFDPANPNCNNAAEFNQTNFNLLNF